MIERVRDFLKEPAIDGLDPDSSEFTAAHRAVLRNKALVRRLFGGFYRSCRQIDLEYFGATEGRRLEIGSGSSFCQELYPDVLTSDLKVLPFVDFAARAEQLPFADNTLRAIYGINVFHHLPDPRAFLREASRVLAPGGGVVLIDPFHGPLAQVLFTRLTASEGFEMDAPRWENDGIAGPMSNANQALSYIVFTRDRTIFEREFPELRIVRSSPHTHLLYLLSGGVNFRQLVPDWCGGLLVAAERVLSPLNGLLALQQTIVLQKVADSGPR